MEATFDLERYRRDRNVALQRRVDYLEGERERLERILATLLLMASRTISRSPLEILNAAIAATGTNAGLAHIHQPETAWTTL